MQLGIINPGRTCQRGGNPNASNGAIFVCFGNKNALLHNTPKYEYFMTSLIRARFAKKSRNGLKKLA